MADDANDPERMARFRLVLPDDPAGSDMLRLEFNFLDIKLRLLWPDSQRNEVLNLLEHARPMLAKCHMEYEVAKEATEIDRDLNQLFPDEEVETGE